MPGKQDNNHFIISVGQLWAGPDGAIEEQDFEVSLSFDPAELILKASVRGHIIIAKTGEEITVILQDVDTIAELQCERCLKKFDYDVTIEGVERVFFSEEPEDDADFDKSFLISRRDLMIDVSDMIRQEIILHFPLISVCSISCKGLCTHCGADKNKKKCNCKNEDTGEQKPFKNLKNLMK